MYEAPCGRLYDMQYLKIQFRAFRQRRRIAVYRGFFHIVGHRYQSLEELANQAHG